MGIRSKLPCIALGAVAVLSLAGNLAQYRARRTASGVPPLTAFFAYADDQGVHALIHGKVTIPTTLGRNLDEASLNAALRNETAFRDYPTADFLVIQNAGEQAVNGVKARLAWGAEPIEIQSVRPAQYVFVPLDFIKPDERARSLAVPPEVILSYTGGRDLRISPANTPVHWLDDHFMRGMPPR
jgi:hypothetical protein